MKKLILMVVLLFIAGNNIFAQLAATNTITNFTFYAATHTYSFDIYARSTGAQSLHFGQASYFIQFNSDAMNTPTLSYINPAYSGDANGTGTPYKTMTVQIIDQEIAVTVYYTGGGSGLATQLSSAAPYGDKICTVTLNISKESALADISWDDVNSDIVATPFGFVNDTFNGENNLPLPVELTTFTVSQSGEKVILNWKTATEVQNTGFDVERKGEKSDWKKIGFIKGNGNSNQSKDYSFQDIPAGENTFQYRLKQIDINGKINYSQIVEVKLELPVKYALEQNYPNPFNPTTNIKFDLPKDSHVSIKVYNMIGQEIADLINGDFAAGYQSVTFDASRFASGTYIYRLVSGNFTQVKKMVLLK
jgi:hypothetical protein